MFRFVASSAFMIIFAATAIAGDPVSEIRVLVEAKSAAELGVPVLQQESDALVKKNESLMQTYNMYADQQKTRLTPLYTAYEGKVTAHNQKIAHTDSEVARWNSVCSGTVPKPVYDKCMSEKPTLQRLVSEGKSSKAKLDVEKADLDRQWGVYNQERDKLGAQMKQNLADWEKAKAKLDEIRRQVANYDNQLRTRCQNESTLEGLKYCHAIAWDGARPDLKPLPTDTPIGTRITPN